MVGFFKRIRGWILPAVIFSAATQPNVQGMQPSNDININNNTHNTTNVSKNIKVNSQHVAKIKIEIAKFKDSSVNDMPILKQYIENLNYLGIRIDVNDSKLQNKINMSVRAHLKSEDPKINKDVRDNYSKLSQGLWHETIQIILDQIPSN